MRRALINIIGGALLFAGAGVAEAQSLKLSADRRDVHVGLPFVLSATAEGFDESPEPKQPELVVPGAQVVPLGVAPSVSSMVSIVNGRRTASREVVFVFRWRITPSAAGNYKVPAITVEQGGKKASTTPATFAATALETTRDMALRVVVPDRPVWLGETFDVFVEWYLRRDVNDKLVVVPLFDAQEWFEVEAPPGDAGDKTLSFSAGAKDVELGYQRDTATLDGVEYTRFRFRARATALKTGLVELPPARVVAALQVGEGRDQFGFRTARTQLFQAEDQPRKLEVRPLPLSGRPASFANAVGTGFALDVQADRTVARAGDPIELTVTVRGQGRLKGLILPDLSADGGLSPKLFALPDQAPAGELVDDGKGKRFRVAVRLSSTEATEIPPLAFSYFDPEAGAYRTVRSRPIALQVAGATKVGAADVVRATPATGPAPGKAAGPASLVGADLSLSREDRTLARALSLASVGPALAVLYGAPLLLLGVQLFRVRTRRRRAEQGAARRALRGVEAALDAAARAPAREAAPQVAAALRALLRTLGLPASTAADLLESLETEAFRPGATELPEALRAEIRSRASGWLRPTPSPAAAASVVALAVVLGAVAARAAEPAVLPDARAAYMQALAETDRDRRTAAFSRAESALGAVVADYPDRPELLTDWGNAALGAQDVGRATLAYRRALRLAPDLGRARRNLDWARKQAPDWLPRPDRGGAIESLFFWHQSLSPPVRHLIAAAAFALALLLLAPFAADPSRRRRLRRAAAIPVIVLAAMAASLAVERDARADAVVTADSVVLRAADSPGAPAVMSRPLPAGAEVTVDESRSGWSRIRLADGATGWVQGGALERVASGK